MKIQTKKFIALFLTVIFGVLAIIAFIKDKQVPSDIITTIGMIIAYYFGAGKNNSV